MLGTYLKSFLLGHRRCERKPLDEICRGPYVFRSDVGPVKPDGYYMLKELGYASKPDASEISRTHNILHAMAPEQADVDANMELITEGLRNMGIGFSLTGEGGTVQQAVARNFELVDYGRNSVPSSSASSAGSDSWVRASQCTECDEFDAEVGSSSSRAGHSSSQPARRPHQGRTEWSW